LVLPTRLESPPAVSDGEAAAVLGRISAAWWEATREAAKEVAQAFGSVYPNAQAYAAERKAVTDALSKVQRRAWSHRVCVDEWSEYMREGGAVPAWWTDYSGGAGGSGVAGQGQWSEGGKGKGKGKGKDTAKGKGKEKEVEKGKGKRRAS
jgi:hypothetical protein